MKKLNKKGFTIVELVIVIAVMAVLAAVLIPTFSNMIDKSQGTKAVSEVKSAYTATLADELATPETSDDIINNIWLADNAPEAIYVKASNDRIVKITKDGAATIVEKDDEAGLTVSYKYANGKIVAA